MQLSVRVPFARLTFMPGDDESRGQVSIYVADMDSHGAQAPVQRAQLPLHLPATGTQKILDSVMGYDLKLVVAPGRQRIALAVRDDVAHISSSLIQEIDVDKSGTVVPVATLAAARHDR